MLYPLLILCVVQSVTEFLPVSSTAHMIVLGEWIKDGPNSALLHVALHLGTLLAIIFFYLKDILNLICSFIKGCLCLNHRDNDTFRLSLKIVIATLPAIGVGYVLKPYLDSLHNNVLLIGICSILFGGLLAFVDKSNPEDQEDISYFRAFMIGIGQLFAFLPGGSRLGTTITVARIFGLSRLQSFKFSMLLSIPVVMGAVLLTSYDAYKQGCFDVSNDFLIVLAITFTLSFIVLSVINKFINRVGFAVFGIYRIIFGIALIVATLIR